MGDPTDAKRKKPHQQSLLVDHVPVTEFYHQTYPSSWKGFPSFWVNFFKVVDTANIEKHLSTIRRNHLAIAVTENWGKLVSKNWFLTLVSLAPYLGPTSVYPQMLSNGSSFSPWRYPKSEVMIHGTGIGGLQGGKISLWEVLREIEFFGQVL